ncbi:MAG: hypothetical protein IJT98_08020 [Prevotella sp.]|nr:hypothetical protein [Prevotella sp.]
MRHKLAVLANIANALNQADITWAVGGSLLLFLKGKVESFHDIDIMVDEDQAGQAAAALASLGRELPYKPNPKYATRHFHEFVIDGVGVDMLAGFVIISKGRSVECPLRADDITGSTEVMGAHIPLHSLAEWHRYYQLMGRKDRADQIFSKKDSEKFGSME